MPTNLQPPLPPERRANGMEPVGISERAIDPLALTA